MSRYKLQPNAVLTKPDGQTFFTAPDWDTNHLTKPIWYVLDKYGQGWIKTWFREKGSRKKHTQWIPCEIPWERISNIP